MGSATLYHLASRGLSVCGIEQHNVAHDLGSSHGRLRAIRRAYFEHPNYLPLLARAYELWEALEEESRETLLVRNGLLLWGAKDCASIKGLEACYDQHDLPHDRLDALEVTARFPLFKTQDDHVAYFDPMAGYLFVEECVKQHLTLAERHGATVRIHDRAFSWNPEGSGVHVRTDKGEFEAGALVITTGPWAATVLEELGVPLNITRQAQLWYDAPNIDDYGTPNFPCFAASLDDGFFYGFPSVDGMGLKVAEHTGGAAADDPDELDRALSPNDEERVLAFLSATFPNLKPTLKHFSACMYSVTPDEHFIVDRHPAHDNVVMGAGFSGHGFKFAPVIGEVLADLAADGQTNHPIDFLKLARFSPSQNEP
jgi:sarcosine oxidase